MEQIKLWKEQNPKLMETMPKTYRYDRGDRLESHISGLGYLLSDAGWSCTIRLRQNQEENGKKLRSVELRESWDDAQRNELSRTESLLKMWPFVSS